MTHSFTQRSPPSSDSMRRVFHFDLMQRITAKMDASIYLLLELSRHKNRILTAFGYPNEQEESNPVLALAQISHTQDTKELVTLWSLKTILNLIQFNFC